MTRGFFITLEGGEGCGKTTQQRMLAEALQTKFSGREIIADRSPGGTPVAEKIRSILKERNELEDLLPQTELLLFGACHSQMVNTMIRPALERGAILVIDRFIDSTCVYQGCARGLDPAFIQQINSFACGSTKPDLTILLDLPVETGLARTQSREPGTAAQDRFDSESVAFHEAIRRGFLTLAEQEKDRFAVVDASRDAESVHRSIMEVIHGKLG